MKTPPKPALQLSFSSQEFDCATGVAAHALTAQLDFHAKSDNRWQMPERDSLCWPYGIRACGNSIVVSDSDNSRVLLWKLAQECRP